MTFLVIWNLEIILLKSFLIYFLLYETVLQIMTPKMLILKYNKFKMNYEIREKIIFSIVNAIKWVFHVLYKVLFNDFLCHNGPA